MNDSRKTIIRSQPRGKVLREKASTDRELLYYGQHICTALAKMRRSDIIRVYYTEERMKPLGELLRWCAKNRKAYHLVSGEELERITGSVHHEGLAILATCPPLGSATELLELLRLKPAPLVFLDDVQNPHNIGTIMRVMANFGWPYLVGPGALPPLTAAAARMSEGGAESVRMFACKDSKSLCRDLKAMGYRLYGTSSHAKDSLYAKPLVEKSVVIMGSEVEGMSPGMEALMDEFLLIPGTGQVESLNVSVACGLLLGEYTRVHGLGPSRALD